jgi:hypothetical protein
MAAADDHADDAIVVSEAAFASADPRRLGASNASVVDALFAEHLTAEEIPQDALRAYFVQFFLVQVENGGFAQFVYNTGWDRKVVAAVRAGLREVGARMHQAAFIEGVAVVRSLGDDLDAFLGRDFWEDGPERAHLDAVTVQLAKAAEVEDLAARLADWLRAHPRLVVLGPDRIEEHVRRRAAAVPDREERLAAARADEPREVRLIRVLCAVAEQELRGVLAGDPTYEFEGATVVAWHFVTDRGHHVMVDAGDRVVMFAADAPDRPLCELNARPGD